MGRSPSCYDNEGGALKKGPWMPEEDKKLKDYIQEHGFGNWKILSKKAGLNRCGKSCRLRWTNYLRPDIKRGSFSDDEVRLIIHLHSILGNKWSTIASRLPGRTDNEIKNYWNTHLRKKLLLMGIDPVTHKPRADLDLDLYTSFSNILGATTNLRSSATSLDSDALRLQADAAHLAKLQVLQSLVQVVTSSPVPNMGSMMSSILCSNALRNYQLGNIIQSNHDIEGLMSLWNLGFSGLNTSCSMYYSESSKSPNEQEMVSQIDDSWSMISEFMMESNGGSPNPYAIISAHPPPSLVSASSEDFTNMIPVQRTIPSLEDSDYDHGWKEILDQISRTLEMS